MRMPLVRTLIRIPRGTVQGKLPPIPSTDGTLSARGNLDGEAILECRNRKKGTPSRHPSVAAHLKMDGQVTAHSAIAYTAVQVCHFSLSLSLTYAIILASLCPEWCNPLDGLIQWIQLRRILWVYHWLYPRGSNPGGKEGHQRVVWLVEPVCPLNTIFHYIDISPDRCFHGLPPLERPRLDPSGGRHSQFCVSNVNFAAKLSSFIVIRILLVTTTTYPVQIISFFVISPGVMRETWGIPASPIHASKPPT